MAYEEVTSPILTDATGQDIVDKLDEIAQNLQPPTNIEASDVSYDNTQSGMTATDVQDAVTELKSNLTEKTKDIASATISSTATTKYTTAGDGWRICMRNGIVSLDMVIDVKSVQSGWTDVGQIPSDFPYPPQVIYFPCNTWSTGSNTKLDLQITAGGVIKMRAGAVAYYYVHLSW